MANLNVLIDEKLRLAAKVKAAECGVTLSDIVRETLERFVSNKDHIQLTQSNAQEDLDRMKLQTAKQILFRFGIEGIRQKSLLNLSRWKESGVWCSAFDEWTEILAKDDIAIMSAMAGTDERCNRLRQSPPYVGLLNHQELEAIREKAAS